MGRLAYFGVPQPNTYYAKVSLDLADQLVAGLAYTWAYLSAPANLGLLLLALALPGVLRLRPPPHRRRLLGVWILVAGTTSGCLIVYSALGGDHFSWFRFYQVLLPILLPLGAASIAVAAAKWPRPVGRPFAGVVLVAAVASGLHFVHNREGLAQEMALGRQGREIGLRLNRIDPTLSLGVVPAGGIALTYEGPIHDLLGLNWVRMAHADRAHGGRLKNHGGFSKAVFYDTLPDIVHPRLMACDEGLYLADGFYQRVLQGLLAEPAFQRLYQFECADGLAFYRRVATAEGARTP